MHAFRIYQPLAAAGLVLLMMNVVTVFPFWPGNVGLVQAAVAVSLAEYGVAYARGFAFGIGLQAIEASVGIGIGTRVPGPRGALVRDAEAASRRARTVEDGARPSSGRPGNRGAGARVPR